MNKFELCVNIFLFLNTRCPPMSKNTYEMIYRNRSEIIFIWNLQIAENAKEVKLQKLNIGQCLFILIKYRFPCKKKTIFQNFSFI